MARVAPRVPELSEVLCTKCGYVLDGLPQTGNCPECGQPIAQSLGGERIPPQWESADGPGKIAGFFSSTLQIIFRPSYFYRTLTVHGPLEPARAFAGLHWRLAAVLFALSGATHAIWFSYRIAPTAPDFPGGKWSLFTVYFYRAFRRNVFCTQWHHAPGRKIDQSGGHLSRVSIAIPPSCLRGLYYHAAHYLPVAVSAIIVVGGYQLLVAVKGDSLPYNSPAIYLYVLSGQIVLSAMYLFQTYWIGMHNMMYANR